MTISSGGKYDELATMVRNISGAMGACVIVIGGRRGAGYAQEVLARSNLERAEITLAIVKALRDVAAQMERDARALGAKAQA